MTGSNTKLRLIVPSDGSLHEDSLTFLQSCGLDVLRSNARQYTAEVPSLPGVQVLFQRAADIPSKVDEGSADLGIVGLDRFHESHREGSAALVVVEDLAFGGANLVIAVPEAWVDVTAMADLADLSVEFRQSGRELRVATKYASLVGRFLHRHGVYYFTLVQSSGALEAAPAIGFADIICDISATGATLRANGLKTLEDGTVFSSQACFIASRETLGADADRLGLARVILERVETRLSGASSPHQGRCEAYERLLAALGK